MGAAAGVEADAAARDDAEGAATADAGAAARGDAEGAATADTGAAARGRRGGLAATADAALALPGNTRVADASPRVDPIVGVRVCLFIGYIAV